MSSPESKPQHHESFITNSHKADGKDVDYSSNDDSAEPLIPQIDKWPEALVRGLGLLGQQKDDADGKIYPEAK